MEYTSVLNFMYFLIHILQQIVIKDVKMKHSQVGQFVSGSELESLHPWRNTDVKRKGGTVPQQ